MIALSINVNKVALIRNSRPGNNPDLLEHVKRCITYGAQGITVHPRPDQRHIRASDCYEISKAINVEFNIEGNPTAGPETSSRADVSDYPGFIQLVEDIRPAQCTLVPDGAGQLTSDHGFDLSGDNRELQDLIQHIKSLGCRVSLFMDPVLSHLERAAEIGTDRIEFYTGPYAECTGEERAHSFTQYAKAAEFAASLGLGINAGHDLNLENLPEFKHLPALEEVSIGHAITVDSMFYGLEETIKRYLKALKH